MTADAAGGTLAHEQAIRREAKANRERMVVLRVYNYFRIVLSFLLIILFFEIEGQKFVGTLEPRWFQALSLVYLALNVALGFFVLLDGRDRFAGMNRIGSIVLVDIFLLTLILLTSGGVDSGLGYLLVFSVAFGSVMMSGQMSLLFPAFATVNSISVELYLDRTGAVSGSQHFFEVAVLGIAFFVVNLFFQYVSRLVAAREQEVVNLEMLDHMHQLAEASRHDLEISNARFNALLRSTGEGVLELDLKGNIRFANQRACELLELEHRQLVGRDIRLFMVRVNLAETDLPPHLPRLFRLLQGSDTASFDPNRWQTARGQVFLVSYTCEPTSESIDADTGLVVLFRNVTAERENEERLQYLANHDALTGLANRTNFKEVLRSAIYRARRSNRGLAVLLIDIDHFTIINEEKGQAFGDETLKLIADRIRQQVREGDLVARLHGDQFSVMLVDMDQDEDAAIVADKINAAITGPMEFAGTTFTSSVSIGISVMTAGQQDADGLISAATSAMQTAKASGRNTYRFFEADVQRKADEKKRVQVMLRDAIEHNEFTLVFQPIVSLKESRIYSSEALIRWHPASVDGPVGPDVFIPIAEESGQINLIGSWVLRTVSQQVCQWEKELGRFPSIAINVSSKQLRNEEFREQFQEILRTHKLPVDVVEMELTETGMMEDPETSLQELIRLRALGVKISIDDFGTGYSSLDYLRRLPLDLLKIDQSFTRGIGQSENDEEIVRVMIRMAHAMGLRVICEGVETREHLDFLLAHDCDFAQGYFFSRPKSIDDLTDLFRRGLDQSFNLLEGLET